MNGNPNGRGKRRLKNETPRASIGSRFLFGCAAFGSPAINVREYGTRARKLVPLFITFEKPMPNFQSVACVFAHQGTVQPGQEDFVQSLGCSNPPMKDADTHYRVRVDIPQDIAAGDYKIAWMNVAVVGEAFHRYQGPDLPNLAPVAITNPKHLEFSPIKKLEVKP